VIIDLGFAKIVENKTYTPCGTPLYLAPEIMLNQGHTISADYWSFGILLFEMIAGRTPFYIKNMDRLTLCSLVIKGDFEFPKNKFSENAQDFIKKVLKVDPRKRLGSLAGGLDELFRHRWFSSIDFAALRRREIEAPWAPTIRDPLDKSQFKKCDGVAPKHNKRYPALTPQAQEIFKDF
jgi:protein kinase A